MDIISISFYNNGKLIDTTKEIVINNFVYYIYIIRDDKYKYSIYIGDILDYKNKYGNIIFDLIVISNKIFFDYKDDMKVFNDLHKEGVYHKNIIKCMLKFIHIRDGYHVINMLKQNKCFFYRIL